jgi:Fe-S cluster assembly iron-binding protein IscA
MLSITTEAAQVIRTMLAGQPNSGLRIAGQPAPADSDDVQLGLSFVAGPAPTDEVVESEGCHVFVDADVAPVLADKTLDVGQATGREQVAFRLLP